MPCNSCGLQGVLFHPAQQITIQQITSYNTIHANGADQTRTLQYKTIIYTILICILESGSPN